MKIKDLFVDGDYIEVLPVKVREKEGSKLVSAVAILSHVGNEESITAHIDLDADSAYNLGFFLMAIAIKISNKNA